MNILNPIPQGPLNPLPQGPQLDLMQQQMFAKALGGKGLQGMVLPPGANPLQPLPGMNFR